MQTRESIPMPEEDALVLAQRQLAEEKKTTDLIKSYHIAPRQDLRPLAATTVSKEVVAPDIMTQLSSSMTELRSTLTTELSSTFDRLHAQLHELDQKITLLTTMILSIPQKPNSQLPLKSKL
ncbi:hypothetical protein FRC02_011466 [Tulasnella sp. 418]|nr:hypothetical protein FRC02_011466 [Tulasnella sp. 418]